MLFGLSAYKYIFLIVVCECACVCERGELGCSYILHVERGWKAGTDCIWKCRRKMADILPKRRQNRNQFSISLSGNVFCVLSSLFISCMKQMRQYGF